MDRYLLAKSIVEEAIEMMSKYKDVDKVNDFIYASYLKYKYKDQVDDYKKFKQDIDEGYEINYKMRFQTEIDY